MRRIATTLALLLELASLGACRDDASARGGHPRTDASRRDPPRSDQGGDTPRTDPSWVDVYEPRAASPGYNLTLFRRRRPLLIDLNGSIVHAWDVISSDRVRLLHDGRLLAIGIDDAVREYDWDGNLVWEFVPPGEDFAHHDVIRLESGNRLLLLHDNSLRRDYLLEVDDAGRTVWEWRSADHLAANIARADETARANEGQREGAHRANVTHVNSIQELPSNRWFDQGDTRFRPGNILISARNLNAIYVIDKVTKEAVWRFDHGLDHQHEATMTPPGFPGAGNILLFNNGLEDRYAYRSSAVIEIDPITGAEVWSYRAPPFFSSTGGTQQVLPNGNVMVTSSRGGRVFEVTRDGRIVWQWAPPFLPMRDARYPYDHCPQLAKLDRPAPTRVERRNRHHVDADLYDFALAHQSERMQVDGRDRYLLRKPNVCRVLRLPERPQMTVRFAFKTEAGTAATESSGAVKDAATPIAVKAAVRLTPAGSQAPASLVFERKLQFSPRRKSWRFGEASVDLREHGLAQVELCFSAESGDGGPPDPRFVWQDPIIRATRDSGEQDEPAAADEKQQAEREKRLRALGYVD